MYVLDEIPSQIHLQKCVNFTNEHKTPDIQKMVFLTPVLDNNARLRDRIGVGELYSYASGQAKTHLRFDILKRPLISFNIGLNLTRHSTASPSPTFFSFL